METLEPPRTEILLAEDDPENAELALAALERAGLAERAFWVRDGDEVLDFLFARGAFASRRRAPVPRVLFLDLKMPRVSGLEVLRAMRSRPQTRHIPVVVFTSSKAALDIQRSYALGVNSYVVKPIEFEPLCDVLREVASYWVRLNACLGGECGSV
jgi:CheY-like chemotaxis protein